MSNVSKALVLIPTLILAVCLQHALAEDGSPGGDLASAVDLSAGRAYQGPPTASSGAGAPAAFSPALAGQGGDSRAGRLSVQVGLGFTASPTDFLLALETDWFVTNNFAVGPLLQFGVDDHPFIFAPTLDFMGMFDIGDSPVKPFVQGGLGVAYYSDQHRHGSDDEAGFLLNFGGGVDFFVAPRVALGTDMLFDIIATGALGDHFFFSWQVVTVRFLF